MGILADRYKRRNPADNPANYTFVSKSGDPADMVPLAAAEGMPILRSYVEGQMEEARQRIPGRIAISSPSSPSSTQKAAPVIDKSNAIRSFAELAGLTPAEREARDRRLQQSKARMAAWTGLFDGLRHLGNLYYTSKGATPQQYGNPYAEIDRNYQEARQLADDMDNYQRQYTQQLWNLRRQSDDDARRNMLADVKAQYYDTRNEVARLKAENDRLRNEAAIRNYDARTKNTDAKTATEEALRGDRVRELVSRINRNNQTGAAAIIRANKTGTGRGRSGRSGKTGNDPYEELADHLQQNPDIVGPILQDEGMGYYDQQSKKFTFTKNATKGMATTANRRTRQQVSNKKSAPKKANGNGNTNTKVKVNW